MEEDKRAGSGPVSVGLLAHVDAGKTTLSEALLYHAHRIRTMGRVDHQDAFLDAHPLERARGITIFSDQAEFTLGGREFFLVDTPGHVDFAAEMERAISVMDAAVLVLSCAEGVQGHTRTVWNLLRRAHVPTFLFLNKTDRAGADPERVLREAQRQLSPDIQPAEALDEAVAEREDDLLEAYLAGELSGEAVQSAARRQIREERLFPCYRGSALLDEGVQALLDGLASLAQTRYDPEAPFGARVFRIRHDAQGNRLTFLKLMGGRLRVRDAVAIGEETCRIGEIRLYNGSRFSALREAQAGQLVAVTGLADCLPGQALGQCEPAPSPLSAPLLSARVEFPREVPVQEVLSAFRKLEAEDPSLGVQWNESLQELHIRVMGVIQLEVLQELVRERFGFSVAFGRPEIVYRETIAAPVLGAGHYEPLRHYAEVHVRLVPLPRGSGIEFASRCHVDDLPLQFQNLVRTHVFEKEHLGVLTGSPIADIRVELLAGRAHLKHTEGGDFRQATYRAIRQGLMKAESILLEPYYAFAIDAPQTCMGRVLSDIQRMSGTFDPPETDGERATVRGRVPVSEMMDYAPDLAALTKGQGHLALRFDGYEPCHNAQEVIARRAYCAEADKENDADSVFCQKGAGFVVHWDKADDWMHCAVPEDA